MLLELYQKSFFPFPFKPENKGFIENQKPTYKLTNVLPSTNISLHPLLQLLTMLLGLFLALLEHLNQSKWSQIYHNKLP